MLSARIKLEEAKVLEKFEKDYEILIQLFYTYCLNNSSDIAFIAKLIELLKRVEEKDLMSYHYKKSSIIGKSIAFVKHLKEIKDSKD